MKKAALVDYAGGLCRFWFDADYLSVTLVGCCFWASRVRA